MVLFCSSKAVPGHSDSRLKSLESRGGMAASAWAVAMGLVGCRLRPGAAAQGTRVAAALQAAGSGGSSTLCLSFPITTAP